MCEGVLVGQHQHLPRTDLLQHRLVGVPSVHRNTCFSVFFPFNRNFSFAKGRHKGLSYNFSSNVRLSEVRPLKTVRCATRSQIWRVALMEEPHFSGTYYVLNYYYVFHLFLRS